MSYCAQIVNDLVTEVIVVNADVQNCEQFCSETLGGEWVETYMNDPDKIYAGIGYTYDAATQNFIPPPQPPAPPRPNPEDL